MKNTLRFICALLCALILFASLCSCSGESENAQSGSEPTSSAPDTKDVPASDGTETAPDTETETGPAPVVIPTVGAEAHRVYDLVFELPEGLTAGSYNGLMGVYEWYTGEMVNGAPTGIYFAFIADNASVAGDDLGTYVKEKSEAAKKGFKAPEVVELNGNEWYRCTISDSEIYYYALFGNGLYSVLTFQGNVSAEEYDIGTFTLEETLFFSPEEY